MARRGDGEETPFIEFLASDGAVFGPSTAGGFVDAGADIDERADPDDEEPRSRWLTIVVAAIVMAVIGVSVMVAAPWSDDGSDASPATTVAPTPTTVGRPGSTVVLDPDTGSSEDDGSTSGATDDASADPGYLIGEIPSGFQLWSARNFDDATPVATEPSDVQVWASPGSTRTTGTWVIVDLHEPQGFSSETGHRVLVGERSGILTRLPDGVTHLTASLGDLTEVTVDSFGIADVDLIAIAASVSVSDRGLGVIGAALPGLANQIHTRRLDVGNRIPQTAARSATLYAGTPVEGQPDHFGGISVVVSDPLADLAAVMPYLVDDFRSGVVGRRPTMSGTIAGGPVDGFDTPPLSVVVFRNGRDLVTVTSSLGVDEVLDLVPSMFLAEPDEWATTVAALRDVRAGDSDPTVTPPTGDGSEPTFSDVADGSMSNSPTARWSVRIARTPVATLRLDVNRGGSGGSNSTSAAIDPTSPLHAFVSEDITIVTAATTDHAASTLRITVEGLAPVDVAVQSFDGVLATASGFEDVGPFTAELLRTDGTVLAAISG